MTDRMTEDVNVGLVGESRGEEKSSIERKGRERCLVAPVAKDGRIVEHNKGDDIPDGR